MQIMPTFAYLAPVTLLFLIGPASAAVVDVIYAMPPAIRITALGIRSVSPTSVEAARSLGATGRQLLAKVQLPMARRTIVLGVNQTIMMALSMVVITALIDAPGLGKNVLAGISADNVGRAFDAGLAIVVMAIMLDRFTTAPSERVDPAAITTRRLMGRAPPTVRSRGAIAVVARLGVALGMTEFPDACALVPRARQRPGGLDLGEPLRRHRSPSRTSSPTASSTPSSTFPTAPWWLRGRRRAASLSWSGASGPP